MKKISYRFVVVGLLVLFSITGYNQVVCKTTKLNTRVVDATLMRKAPYLLYTGNNAEYQILWQLNSTQTSLLKWGTDTTYSLNSIETVEYGTDHQHKYKFTNLTPGTKYYYSVVVNSVQYKGNFYSAPSDTATSVKFIAYGDSRSEPDNHNRVAGQILKVFSEDPEYQGIIVFEGDAVHRGQYEADWDNEFFDSQYENMQKLRGRVGYQFAIGNHEDVDVNDVYSKYFFYPYQKKYYWAFDYGPVHFMIVDQYMSSYSSGSEQMLWLENELKTTNKKWKIVVMHKVGYSIGHHDYDQKAIDVVVPLCEKYGVKVILGGHNHIYSRFFVNGVHSITAGGGGASILTEIDSSSKYIEYMKKVAFKYHFCKLEIDNDNLFFEAIDDSGNKFDNFVVSLDEEIYDLKTNVEGLGHIEISPDSNYYHAGTQVTLTAVPDSGWEFESWDGGVSGTESPIVITVDGDKIITAKFKNPNGGILDVQIKTGSDDAEEEIETGKVSLKSSDLELVVDGTEQIVGMRFTDIMIPTNATITKAYIQFTTDEKSAGSCSLTIRGESTDNATTFLSNSKNISNRETTHASVAWAPPYWRTVGESGSKQQTPELKTVIQEIVSRSGWSSGNSLALIISGTGERTAESYNGSPDGAPILHVEYSTLTSVKKKDNFIPMSYSFVSHPNPFNPSTQIEFRIPENGWVKVLIYDILGEEIEKIVDGYFEKGSHSLFWNAKINGCQLPSGIYIARMESGNYMKSIKMALLK